MKTKKAEEMAISTILLIVLGIAILTILILVLGSQTGFFSDFLDNLRGKSNLDFVINSCNSLVDSGGVYSYCCEKRDVKLGKGKKVLKLSCFELKENELVSGRINNLECLDVKCS